MLKNENFLFLNPLILPYYCYHHSVSNPERLTLEISHLHTILTCKGKSVLLLLSVLNTLSSIQDFGVSDGVERVNFGGAMTLPENGFFSGDIWFIVPGMPMFPVLRWSLPCMAPQDILPVPQPLLWWLLQGDCFRRGWEKHISLNYRPLKSLSSKFKF